MSKTVKFLLATVLAATYSITPVSADAGHGAKGSMPGMTADMRKKHEMLEAKLTETSAFGVKGDPKSAIRTIKIDASEIQFNIKTLRVKAGDTVKFVVSNKGEQTHEFTIGDAKYQDFARQMMTQLAEIGADPAAPEHIKLHAASGNTAVVQIGETKEIVWTFTKSGAFEFSCNLIGHSESGMKGTIAVQ
jgi:uncharacterized cupredoxin-like copper-binding protein